MKRLLPLALVALSCLGIPDAQAAGRGVTWRGWDDGMREAQKAGRPVMVDVYTDWCGWCKRMDRDVYARPEVRDYLARRFVPIKLNAESPQAANYEGKRWTSRSLATGRFRVSGYPTTIFLRANGEHLANLPGYIAPERFLLLLRYVGDGAMDRGVSFDDFSRDPDAHTAPR